MALQCADGRLRLNRRAAKMATSITARKAIAEDFMGTQITFKRPDGKEAAGYLANAARGNAPGVVVIQEWWGLSEQIKGLCDRFAVAGFDADCLAREFPFGDHLAVERVERIQQPNGKRAARPESGSRGQVGIVMDLEAVGNLHLVEDEVRAHRPLAHR